jgi:hypothetical protein
MKKLIVVNMTPGVEFTTLFFFVTYELSQLVRPLESTRLERLVSNKYSSLLVPFHKL